VIPTKFSAAAFGLPLRRPASWKQSLTRADTSSAEAERLAAELRTIVEPRVLGAADPAGELDSVIDELRALGHTMVRDEDDDDWRIFADVPERNLAIWTHWEPGSKPRRAACVEVLWQKM
jgi:hypothetical protein